METIVASDPESRSADIVRDNLERLKEMFPEACTEGKVDFDVLRQLLGGAVDESDEKYGLNWHGKRRVRKLALTPSTGTLRPCPGDSVDWDTTQNLMIEGDNLEVLKLLQKSYAGKVKLIYIDPPYNTGKDFVYPDDYRDNMQNYLKLTGQIDDEKRWKSSNTEASGRFHTDWLNMIYPRIKLARNLLKVDGLIAVSVDDTEVANMRKVLDEVFGEDQFQAQIIIQSNKRGQTYKQIAKTHEFLIIYSKYENVELNELEKRDSSLPFSDSLGPFDLWELRNRNPKFGRHNRPNLFFPIYVHENSLDECGYSKVSLTDDGEDSISVYPINSKGEDGCWRWGKDKISKIDLSSDSPVLVARKRRDGEWNVYQKSRKNTTKPKSIWLDTQFINEQGTIELGRLGMGDVFDHPKPVSLLQRCIFIATKLDDIVLDFFAGSGTTAHAVMEQNLADGGKRAYMLVQLPQTLDPQQQGQRVAAGFCDKIGKPRTLAELTKERLRRAARKCKDEKPSHTGDLGFRIFKLDSSNIRAWNPTPDDLEGALLADLDHIEPGRTEEDILYELLLKLGLDLCVPIEARTIADKSVQSVGAGTLMVCLDGAISRCEAEPLALGIADWHQELAPGSETTVLFRDVAFADDVVKTNLAAILQQRGLSNVRSL